MPLCGCAVNVYLVYRKNFSLYTLLPPTLNGYTNCKHFQREKKILRFLNLHLITLHHSQMAITYLFLCRNERLSKTWRTKILRRSDVKYVILERSIMCSACEFRERKWRGRKVIGYAMSVVIGKIMFGFLRGFLLVTKRNPSQQR